MADPTTGPFPPVTISGIEVVTIPLAHYADLLDCKRRLGARGAGRSAATASRTVRVNSRSRLFDDPEVTDFLMEVRDTMRLTAARNACIERFGENRAPSRSAIGRFWQRRRGDKGR